MNELDGKWKLTIYFKKSLFTLAREKNLTESLLFFGGRKNFSHFQGINCSYDNYSVKVAVCFALEWLVNKHLFKTKWKVWRNKQKQIYSLPYIYYFAVLGISN